MKILLLNLNWAESGELGVMGTEQACLPLEFLYIRSDLKKNGFDSSFIDLFSTGATIADIENELRDSDMVVTCSAPSYVFWRDGVVGVSYAKDSIREIKRVNPGTTTVLIGPHGTALPDTLFMDELDYLVRGEPDLSISRLVDSMKKGDPPPDNICHKQSGSWVSASHSAEIPDLDALPIADYDGVDLARYRFPTPPRGMGNCLTTLYEASRGCMHSCVYCWRSGFRDKYRTKSVARIRDELSGLKANGVRYVYLIDEVFPTSSAWCLEVCGIIEEAGIKWGAQTRPEHLLDETVMDTAVRTGCRILEVGLETTDRECYRLSKKTEKVDLSALDESVRQLASHGIQVVIFLLSGLPGDSQKSLLKMAKSFKGFLPDAIPGGLWNVIPLPGTELWNMGIKEGKPLSSWRDAREYEGLIGNRFRNREHLERTRKRASDYLQILKETSHLRSDFKESVWTGFLRARRVALLLLRYRSPWLYRLIVRVWRALKACRQKSYDIRICIIGCGRWAGFYSDILSGIPGVELFFCSRNPVKARSYSRKYRGGGSFNTVREAIQDQAIDAFMIFTPHNAHIENVRDLSMCGKYVLLQKPIAGTLEDAAEICRLCEEKRMKLMVGENYRFSPALDKAKRLLAMGKIGKPVSVSVTAMSKSIPTGWRTRKEANGGGVLVDFGIHYLSALRHLCGEPQEISSVSCEHRIPGAEGESSIGFSAIMECGVVATADIAWGIGENADQKDIITITGEKGSITVDLSKAYITLDRKGRKRRLRLGSSDKYGHRTLLASFLTAAMEGLPINLDHKTGAGDLAFVKKVYASVATDPKRRDSGR